jgi:sugar O-acyltransferase (sialic acid O-acetyltransferase NeuD family)
MKEDSKLKMEKIIIFGMKEMAEIAHFYFSNDSAYIIEAFTVNRDFIKEEKFLGLPVLPFENIERYYPTEKFGMFIAVGYSNLNKVRAEKYYEAKNKGYRLVSCINSKIFLWGDTKLGDNCFIGENQTIQPFVNIGNNVTITGGGYISHNSFIGDHCYIAPDVAIGGFAKIGEYCFLGMNATIRNAITIARENIIGAGALILKNTKEKDVYISMPTELYQGDSSQIKLQ